MGDDRFDGHIFQNELIVGDVTGEVEESKDRVTFSELTAANERATAIELSFCAFIMAFIPSSETHTFPQYSTFETRRS